MAIDITVYWGGPSDAAAASTYKIERSFDLTNWSELAAAQAATSPYASPTNTLDTGGADYGDTTLNLVSGTSISTSGHGYVGKAHVVWTGKTSNQLTGVTWYTGAGSYAAGTAFVEAHETYADVAVEPTNLTVFYRITHAKSGVTAPAGFVVHYVPPAPASPDHCILLVVIGADASGMYRRAGVDVNCYLSDDTAFDPFGGQADANRITASNTQTTGVDGACAFQLWKTAALSAASGATLPTYTVVLGANETGSEQTYTITTVPERDWLLLSEAVA